MIVGMGAAVGSAMTMWFVYFFGVPHDGPPLLPTMFAVAVVWLAWAREQCSP